ncbi:MAG: molybdopterin cofactor-binding domain-containing protein, partial [Acidobacteriota bacterium]
MTTRRDFVKLSLIAGSAFAIGFDFGDNAAPVVVETPFRPNGWVRIEADGTVTLTVGKSEMGQGVRTSLPMILAEELEAEWSSIHIVQASPDEHFKNLGTGGSWSIGGSWKPLRQAGATAREMLITAAAARLGVARASLRAERGFVIHDASSRRLGYGELTAAASALPVPSTVALKKTSDFKIVGRPTKRTDGRAIVTGRAKYGIDTRVPGMRHATIVRPPVLGGSVRKFDATRARAVRGVRYVVKVSSGVAIVADNTWAALKGRELLDIEFEPGANAGFSSELHSRRMREALNETGFSTRQDGETVPSPAKRIEATYAYPFYAHAPLEPMNSVADVRRDTCELWSPTQAPNDVQTKVAALLGIPPASVKVNVTLCGGGFGRRLGWDYA